MKRKIYYYDTDCGGVVYHANYLHFFEEARTYELEKMGLTVKQLMQDNCYFVVNHQEIFYRWRILHLCFSFLLAQRIPTEPRWEVRNVSLSSG